MCLNATPGDGWNNGKANSYVEFILCWAEVDSLTKNVV